MIGLLPGALWGSSRDRVLVVGAHWDTLDTTDGLNDNGSGVAALLEAASVLSEAKCRTLNSVLFVAFDLEELGMQGSLEFVHRFLIPDVLKRFGQNGMSGAIVIDTVLNANATSGSQDLTKDAEKLLPSFSDKVKANGFRGDFLQVIGRKKEASEKVRLGTSFSISKICTLYVGAL